MMVAEAAPTPPDPLPEDPLAAMTVLTDPPAGAAPGAPRGGVTVARALGSETRAGIFARLRETGEAHTVRDVAAAFDLHPNVARTHLQTLAEAGLVTVGRRKHPGGGRPARVYTVADDAPDPAAVAAGEAPQWSRPGLDADPALLVRLLAGLLDAPGTDASGRMVVGRAPLPARAHEIAAAEGRRISAAVAGRRTRPPSLAQAAQEAVRALAPWAPDARVVRTGDDWVDVAGSRGVVALLVGVRPELADALERGLVTGLFAGAGVPVTVVETSAGTATDGPAWRARATGTPSARAGVASSASVDVRGDHREAGVVAAMRAVTRMTRGEVLEVLAEGPGSPAAFARWADRAGHQLLGVERAVDATGRPAIRLLIRKGR